MKKCSRCGAVKPYGQFNRCRGAKDGHFAYCRPCNATYKKAQYRAMPKVDRKRWMLRKYGLTLEQYEKMLEAQGGLCCICGGPGGFWGLGVDHCHETGQVRGLLCSSCNAGIAMFKHNRERMESAIQYLIEWGALESSSTN